MTYYKWSEIKRKTLKDRRIFRYIKERNWRLVRRELRIMWFYYLRNYFNPIVHLKKIFFWFRARLFVRGHVIRLRGLKPGYYDPDHRMLVGIFTVLCEYVEKELGGLEELDRKIIFWDSFPTNGREANSVKKIYLNHFREVKALYIWWTKEREEIDHGINRIDLYEKETQMALRAVKIRDRMWT